MVSQVLIQDTNYLVNAFLMVREMVGMETSHKSAKVSWNVQSLISMCLFKTPIDSIWVLCDLVLI